jgi:hypothetical protein
VERIALCQPFSLGAVNGLYYSVVQDGVSLDSPVLQSAFHSDSTHRWQRVPLTPSSAQVLRSYTERSVKLLLLLKLSWPIAVKVLRIESFRRRRKQQQEEQQLAAYLEPWLDVSVTVGKDSEKSSSLTRLSTAFTQHYSVSECAYRIGIGACEFWSIEIDDHKGG